MTTNPDGLSDARAVAAAVDKAEQVAASVYAGYPFPKDDDMSPAVMANFGARCILAATPPASTSTAIAAGFVMVPVEPTEAIILAGIDYALNSERPVGFDVEDYVHDIWAAMIAAAPKAADTAIAAGEDDWHHPLGLTREEVSLSYSGPPPVRAAAPKAASEDGATGLLREALALAVDALRNYAAPEGYLDQYGDPYTTDDVHPGLLAKETLAKIAALNLPVAGETL